MQNCPAPTPSRVTSEDTDLVHPQAPAIYRAEAALVRKIASVAVASPRNTNMSSNKEFVASIEALLAAAKSYDVEKPDRLARVGMLGRVQALHYQLEAPEEAMFRQLTNVCDCHNCSMG